MALSRTAFERGRRVEFGHHFLIGLQPSPILTEADKRLLSTLRPAGVVLFKANFDHAAPYQQWLATYARLLDDVRGCIGRERILVCIDHEGGGVFRPPPPITHFAYARQWRDQAAEVGGAMGRELRALGINVSFAPCVDVNSNPDNPVIGDRAFGTTVDAVVQPALAFLGALQGEAVFACPKHFPGHGDVQVDSHYTLPVLEVDLETLKSREIPPFRAMVEAQARLIMSAHVLFPNIDPGRPATLSRLLLDDLLRGELGYDGVVVTDDIGMGAVSDLFERAEAIEQLLGTGSDLICLCAYWTRTERALAIARHIADGRRSGAIAGRTLDRSAERIDRLLAEAPVHPVVELDPGTFSQHRTIAPLRAARSATDRSGAAKI